MKTSRFVLVLAAVAAAGLAGCQNNQKTEPAASSDGDANVRMVSSNYVNTKCPMMGSPISGERTTVAYNGQRVGFCCPGCAGKWESLTDAQKAEKFAAAK